MGQDGRLENSFKRPDKISTIIKTHKNVFKLQTLKHKKIVRSAVGIFRTNHSITNGSDVTVANLEALPITNTFYFNDNKTFVRPLTFSDDLSVL
jgi:hypothetical protein